MFLLGMQQLHKQTLFRKKFNGTLDKLYYVL